MGFREETQQIVQKNIIKDPLYLEVYAFNILSEYSPNLHLKYHFWGVFLLCGFPIKPGKRLRRW